MGLFIQHKGYPIALHPTASDCEFAVWNFTVGFCMNAADALSLLRAQAAENANGATVNLATSTTAPPAFSQSTVLARWL